MTAQVPDPSTRASRALQRKLVAAEEEVARLRRELAEARAELAESREAETAGLARETATAEILRLIAGSPTDLESVLGTVAETAMRVCGARDAAIFRCDGDVLRLACTLGPLPVGPSSLALPLNEKTATGRSVVERRTIHVHDLAAVAASEYPEALSRGVPYGSRTVLATPLLQDGEPLGAILIRRGEVQAFTDKQIALLETFADQAVIAIENTRLFRELEERNRELQESNRQVTEALEQQTATAEVLRIIATSPTELQPVLDAVAENAAWLCECDNVSIFRVEGERLRKVAENGPLRGGAGVGEAFPITPETATGRAVLERRTVNLRDLLGEEGAEFPLARSAQAGAGTRTILATPLLREGAPIGGIVLRRSEVRPFTEQQIKLLETFADQAVIAVENVRLFQELQERNRDLSEALDRQTATSEILRVIASSPTELQPVLDTIAERAARLCDATNVAINLIEGDRLVRAAVFGPFADAEVGVGRPLTRGSFSGRAVIERRTLHVEDIAAVSEAEYPDSRRFQQQFGYHSGIVTPLLRDVEAIGTISILRMEVRPFTERQIELAETFADQAVIAIENTRLFTELEDRVGELQALGEVGHAVVSSLDLEQVLSTIVSHAVQLSGTEAGAIYEFDEAAQVFALRATHQLGDDAVAALRATPPRLGEGAVGRAGATRRPVQIADVETETLSTGRLRGAILASGTRALLSLPLLREERVVGGLSVFRQTPGAFPERVVELLQTFASQSALAIENARLYRELQLASTHKSEFLANMSHELRTPLNAIIGFSEVLSEQMFGELNDRQLEYQQDILTSGQHLLSLINDILDLSKVEAGQMELEPREFSLRAALESGLTMLKERAGRHGITLGLEIEPGLDVVQADERKVKQVVFNLLSNAVKFTPDGGRVDISAQSVDGVVQIAVRDTGVGIAPEDLEHVFEEFRQTSAGRAQSEGTGLGLPLAKRFVELHGGRMWVESQVGVGSIFTFSLPQPAIVHEPDARP